MEKTIVQPFQTNLLPVMAYEDPKGNEQSEKSMPSFREVKVIKPKTILNSSSVQMLDLSTNKQELPELPFVPHLDSSINSVFLSFSSF